MASKKRQPGQGDDHYKHSSKRGGEIDDIEDFHH